MHLALQIIHPLKESWGLGYVLASPLWRNICDFYNFILLPSTFVHNFCLFLSTGREWLGKLIYIADPLTRRKERGRRNDCHWGFFGGVLLAYLSLFYSFSFLKHCFLLLLPQPPGIKCSCSFLLNMTAGYVTHAAQPLHGCYLAFSKWMMSSLADTWPRRDSSGSVDCWAASLVLSV